MISHYIKIALRFMRLNAGISTLNIAGFTIGLTAGLMIYLWVVDELRYDAFHSHANHIYRVVQLEKNGDMVTKKVRSSPSLGEDMQKMFPQIADHTFIYCEPDYAYALSNGSYINIMPATVDKNFFAFFDYTFVEGNPTTAFRDDQSIVITEKFARKLFGKNPALGQELTISQIYSKEKLYRIGGVVRLPHNTHISFDVASQREMQGYTSSGAVYLRFDEKAKFNEQTQESLSRYLIDYTKDKNLLTFQPLKDIHLKTDFSYFPDRNLGDQQYVVVFSILALIIVLMGAFNFMTLSTAQATKRIKEVAARKVYGSRKSELMTQFFSETLIQVFIALLLALALTQLLLPYLNSFTGKNLTLFFSWRFWITVALSLFFVGLVAGSYPALYLSSFSPMMIFKGGNTTGRKTGFANALAVLQFSISIGLIICTLVVFRQLAFINNKDLGIERENIITTRCNLWYGVGEFKQEVLRNPNVLSVSMSGLTPEAFFLHSQNVTWEGKTSQDTVQMNLAFIDGDFAETYGLKIVQGERLLTSFDDYWNRKGGGVMINEAAARLMGMDDPVGKTLNNNRIVAVVRDFHFRSLKEPIVPLMMMYNPETLVNISFKLSPGNQKATIAFIKETYERMRPGTGFEYRYFEDLLAENYKTENQLARLFMLFTLLSLVISCLGIFGLTALSTVQRTKEIGLRKISGATVMSIMILLNKNYMLRIAIAFVIAFPISSLLMNRWLQNYAYHTPLSWWIFALAGLITFLIAILTISWLCYQAARRRPVELIRYE